jgi:hypothetical protein
MLAWRREEPSRADHPTRVKGGDMIQVDGLTKRYGDKVAV